MLQRPALFTLAIVSACVFAHADDTKRAEKRAWDPSRDYPLPVAEDKAVRLDYPIAYVRVPRPYPEAYNHINHLNQAGLHQTNAPGAELRLLHPDGKDELLVGVEPQESITDPMVSLDGQWVYFAKFHKMVVGSAHMTKLHSAAGADIYKIHLPTRKLVQITKQERTPNTGAVPAGVESHVRGVHNLAPCPVAGGKVVFCSDRNGYRGVREQTQPALQLFIMDEDGSNIELIGPMNLGTALHPVPLKDGRIMFSSLETQGLRSDERWGIWAIHPDGTNWSPLTSALGSPPGQAVHFQAQLSDGQIVVESYYQTGSTDGFGTYWRVPIDTSDAYGRFEEAAKNFKPRGMADLTLFASFQDIRPNHASGDVSARHFFGNVTHPSGAPDNHLLTVWAPPSDAQDQSTKVYDAGLYLIKEGKAINHPSKMRLIKNDPKFQELWPRAVVPFERIYGSDPPVLTHRNDGKQSPHLPAGTPFGLVGTSSLYKRETYPGGVVPDGSVTAVSSKPNDRLRQWHELSVARFGRISNWGEQGADAGLYENSDIWGVRILVLEPVSEAIHRNRHYYALGSKSEERIRILGEFPVRKFGGRDEGTKGRRDEEKDDPQSAIRDPQSSTQDSGPRTQDSTQPLDPDGNPDTSFLAKIPADVAWTFQTLDHNGMVLNMSQTWHQVRPGELRNNCGGCHAHSQKPTPFELTAATKPDYKVWDLTRDTPLFTSKANDRTGKQWDKDDHTGVTFAGSAVKDVEFYRNIKPLLDRSCVACHTTKLDKPAGDFAMDDETPLKEESMVLWAENVRVPRGLPTYYARIVQYTWAFQSRRSPLIWKVHGKRLDGFSNEDVPSPEVNYADAQHIRNWAHHSHRFRQDVDFTGSVMPPREAIEGTFQDNDGKPVKVPALSDEEKLTLARWIDLGCPIDLDFDPKKPDSRGRGWLLDEGRPTLTLAEPVAGTSDTPLTHIRIGMHDYMTGLDMASFTVAADFAIDNAKPGDNLASRFKQTGDGIWEMKLKEPISTLPRGTLTVSVKDKQGNITRIERTLTRRSTQAARPANADRAAQ